MINEKYRLIWAAGLIDGCGVVITSIEQGPTRMYAAFSLLVRTRDRSALVRMKGAVNNGEILEDDQGFLLSGYAATRGFIAEVWPWLSTETKERINIEIRKYKVLKADLLARKLKA